VTVWVDTRWGGNHGIGRFAREVCRRLSVTERTLTGRSPTSALDVLNPQRLRLSRRDVLYSPGWNAGITSCPQLLTIHDLMHLDVERRRGMASYYERVVKPAVRRAGVVFTVSEQSRREILGWVGEGVEVCNVGNGVSGTFRPVPSRRDPDGGLVVLYVGNVRRHKRFDVVVRTLAEEPGARLRVVSSGADEAEAAVARAGLLDRTVVLRDLTDAQLLDEYARCDVLMMPSEVEGFGLPAAEATAVGTPVVHWAGCGGLREMLGPLGLPVDDLDDVDAWRRALHAAAATPRLDGRPDHPGWLAALRWESVAARVDSRVREYVASGSRVPRTAGRS